MKNSKRLLAMILIASICAGTASMPVFAEDAVEEEIEEVVEGETEETEETEASEASEETEEYPIDVTEETIENADGTVTELTATKTTEVDENGNITVTLTIDKVTEGTNTDGAKVEGESSETEKTVTDGEGNVVEESSASESITVTTETEVNEDGNTTVTETIVETKDEVNADGSTLDYDQTTVNTKTENADGSSAEQSVVDGTEKKERTEEDAGEGAQPDVTVDLIPGAGPTTGTARETVVEGDIPEGEGDTEYDYTKITTTDRTVEAEASDMKVTENEVNDGLVGDEAGGLIGITPVYDETDGAITDADGKNGVFDRNYLSSINYDYFNINGVIIWVDKGAKTIVDVVVPEGAELPEHPHLENVTVGASVNDWYNSSNIFKKNEFPADIIFKNQIKINDINNWYTDEEHEDLAVTIPEGGEYRYVGTGEHSKYFAGFVTVVYAKDEVTDEPLVDENGDYIIEALLDSGGNLITIDGEPATELLPAYEYDGYSGSRAQTFMLMDKNGNRVYGYCCDLGTPTSSGKWYSVANLEDSNYYASEESEKHIRSIAMNGYWGTSDIPDENGEYEFGSLESIKAKLKDAIANGELDEMVQVIKRDTTTEGRGQPIIGEDGKPVTTKMNILDILDGMTEGEAMLATQAAIWSYANGYNKALNGEDANIIMYPDWYRNHQIGYSKNEEEHLSDEAGARVEFLYNWLINLDTEEESSVVINEKNFVEEMSLTVKDKVEEHEDNLDDDETNDVYNTDLNFKLAFIPGDNDDLLVQITYNDLEGNPVTVVRRLAGVNDEGEIYEDIKPEADGSYVLRGLQLSENKELEFDLRLEGTQVLENGVYIYEAMGGRDISQTFVGIAEGERNVDVSASMTISFDVDEDNHVVAEREWHYESDPVIVPVTPPETPEEPVTPPVEPVTPPEEPEIPETPEEDPEIPEEDPETPEDDPETPEDDPVDPVDPVEEPVVIIEDTPIPEAEPEVIIEEEDIPLTDIPDEPVPTTGDSFFWHICSAIAALGLSAVTFFDKKRKNGENA